MTINEYVSLAKQNGTPIVDVRPEEIYDAGHIPGAVNIPLSTMRTAEVKNGSDLYCDSGYRAGVAKLELERRGIESVDIGGMDDYTGPVERS